MEPVVALFVAGGSVAIDAARTTQVGPRVIPRAAAKNTMRPAGRAVRASLSSAGRTLISRVVTLDQLEPYAELDLDRLSRQPTPAIYFLRGAPPIDPFRTAATTSPDQLEDLRALGYID